MKKETPPSIGFAPNLAAMHLSTQLGGTQELWLYRLSNWRRPGRHAPIEWGQTVAGNPTYAPEALEKFVAEQLGKQALIAESQSAAPVRAFATALLDSPNERPHVRVSFAITGASQSVFSIHASTARQLADLLTKAADRVEHAASVGAA